MHGVRTLLIREAMMKNVLAVFALIMFSVSVLHAESFFRIRSYQPSPLATDGGIEKKKIKSGNQEIPISSNPSKSQGWMVSYGLLGLGISSHSIDFSFENADFNLESQFQDLALIFGGLGTTTFSIGTGSMSSGKAEITSSSTSSTVTGSKASGSSVFVFLGLNYDLPLDLSFIGLKNTEFLLGYRELSMTYEGFEGSGISIGNKLKLKSVHYLFGVGLVF